MEMRMIMMVNWTLGFQKVKLNQMLPSDTLIGSLENPETECNIATTIIIKSFILWKFLYLKRGKS